MKREIAAQASSIFGIDIDPEEIDDTPESFERLTERVLNEFEDKMTRGKERSSKHKKIEKAVGKRGV